MILLLSLLFSSFFSQILKSEPNTDFSEAESLRSILESGRSNRKNEPLHIQLEAKQYYSDGIEIENEDLILSGVN